MQFHFRIAGIFMLALGLCFASTGSDAAESGLHDYSATSGLNGTISSVGSDTMVYLVSFWTVEFKKHYPQVQVQIAQAGSATAPPALLRGEATIAPMSRKMNEMELASFEVRYGYKPTEIRVALDTLAVYVNQKNPITGLSLPQVDAMFSVSRRCGELSAITQWGQAGVAGEWAGRSIELVSRNTISGTFAFFREHALCKGEFNGMVRMKPTSVDVVSAVIGKPDAVGYSGIGYMRPGVRALPLSEKTGEPYVEATAENARSGRYPLTRFLYIYVNKVPGKPLPVLEREFLRYVLSKEGQAVVANDGFVALSTEQVQAELNKLN